MLKTAVDPVGVAGTLYLLEFAQRGQVSGLTFCLGILAVLLAGYLLSGASVFLRGRSVAREVASLLGRWTALLAIIFAVGQLSGLGRLIDSDLIAMWALATPAVLLGLHGAAYLLIERLARSEQGTRTAIIVGATRAGRALASVMAGQNLLRFNFLGYFDDRSPGRSAVSESAMLGRLREVADYASRHEVRAIYITLPMTSQPRILALLDSLRDTTASVYFVPDMFVFDLIQARFDHVGGIPVVSVCDSPFQGFNGLIKRAADLALGTAILTLIWPLMLAVAVAVKLTSPGPVIFRQRRYGLDGQDIVVYKFRTMNVMEDGPAIRQAVRDDPRLTPIGGFLRRTSLDELPQFVNVLQGRMSVVGPRPHANAHNEQYRRLIKGYMVRHKVRPGITGWAQVNGYRGETDTIEKMRGRVAYDLDYLRNWSLWLDLKIIIRTIVIWRRDRQAY